MKIIEGIPVLTGANEAVKENVPPGTIYIYKNDALNSCHPVMWSVSESMNEKIAEVYRFDAALRIAKLFAADRPKPMTNDEKFEDACIRS